MAYDNSNFTIVIFGVDGAPADGEFLPPGRGPSSAAECAWVAPYACQIVGLAVYCRVAPGMGVDDDYTINIDGAASAATVQVTDANQAASWSGAASVAAGERLSCEYATSGGGAADDCQAAVTLLVFE